MPGAEARLIGVEEIVGVKILSDLFFYMPLQYFTAHRKDGDRPVVYETGLAATLVERSD